MKALPVVLIAATLVACGPPKAWVKPGVDRAQAQKDYGWCYALGKQEVGYLPDEWIQTAPAVMMETIDKCMRGKGYALQPAG